MNDPDNDEKQSGYRIQFFDSRVSASAADPLLDTGWVMSSQTSVSIKGLSSVLKPNSLYYWKVATKDKDGNASAYSRLSCFSTAIENEWKTTKGIWAAGQNGKSDDDFCFVRTSFSLPDLSGVDKVLLSATGLSPERSRQYIFNIYVNDRHVGMGPSRLGVGLDGGALLYYNTYDITDLLVEGENGVGAVLYALEGKSFLFQAAAFYQDGSKRVLLNSGDEGKGLYSLEGDDIFRKHNSIGTGYYVAHSNNIDANKFPFGFSRSTYLSRQWLKATVCEELEKDYTLTPYSGESVGRHYLPTDDITLNRMNDSYIVDFHKEFIGGFGLELESPNQTEVILKFGEQLNEDGTVKFLMNTANRYYQSWKLKVGRQRIENYDMFAYRYVQIDGLNVEITKDNIIGIAYHIPWETRHSFSSTDPLLNEIYSLLEHTAKVTTQDLFVDSQTRERAPYEGDALINFLLASLFDNNHYVSRFSFEYLYAKPTWPSEYLLLTTEMALRDYYETGDDSSLSKYYEVLKQKVFSGGFDQTVNLSTNLSGQDYYLFDWPQSERDGYDIRVKYNTVFNSLNVDSYLNIAQIAEHLSREEDAAFFHDRAQKQKQSIIEKLYDNDTGSFSDGLNSDGSVSEHRSYHATAMALACGVYSDSSMADRMARFLKKPLRTSVYFSYFVFKGLYKTGHSEMANEILLDKDDNNKRTWNHMIHDLGATVATEAWDETIKGNMTFSHPWGATPAYAIKNGLFGIEATKPGYEEFEVRIGRNGPSKAAITVPTVKGDISVSFDFSDQEKINLVIPANTAAKVILPERNNDEVIVDGKRWDVINADGQRYIFVGSGSRTLAI